jgi:hypothetical protein
MPASTITITVAIVGILLCLVLPKRFALLPLAAAMCLYPSNMLLPPEGSGLTAQRVIGLALLARCIVSTGIRGSFKWGIADTIAAVYFGLLLVSQMISQGLNQAMVNRGGFFLSAMAPFWCARFLITDRPALYSLIKGFIWSAVPLSILGLVFMKSGYSPYYPLLESDPLFFPTNDPENLAVQRMFLGQYFFRAHAPFQQCIMFGWFFALWLVPATNLFFEKRSLWPWVIAWLMLPLGTISSVAAGPMMFAAFSFGILTLFPARQHGTKLLYAALAVWLAFSVFSKRSAMEHLAAFGMDEASSYYRVGLQDEILKRGAMGGHWLAGYGEVPPHFGRFHDLCIHWVSVLVFNGMMGVVGFYGLLGVAFWSLWKARHKAGSIPDQWLLWSFLATLIGALAAMSVVSLFSEMYYIFHLFLALVINAPRLIGEATSRQVGVPAMVGGKLTLLRYTLGPGQRLAIVRPGRPPRPPRS